MQTEAERDNTVLSHHLAQELKEEGDEIYGRVTQIPVCAIFLKSVKSMGKQPTQQQEEGARQGQYKVGFVSPLIQTWQMGLIFVLIL